MKIKWVPSSNFRTGRKGRKIIAIVNHITAGLMPGTLSWMTNPAAQASAHYLVTKKGQIYQLVKDEDTAWHSGEVRKPSWPLYDGSNPNYYTIGIEHEALAGDEITEPQYQATLWLHAQLIQKHTIPLDRDHVIGHYRIDGVNRPNDPGPGFPWDRLMGDLATNFAQDNPAEKAVNVDVRVMNPPLQGIIIHDVSYVPVREFVEMLGRQVEWNATLKAVLIPPVSIQVPVSTAGTVQIVINDTIIPGLLIEGKSYAPVRQLGEMLGRKVRWDPVSRIVMVE